MKKTVLLLFELGFLLYVIFYSSENIVQNTVFGFLLAASNIFYVMTVNRVFAKERKEKSSVFSERAKRIVIISSLALVALLFILALTTGKEHLQIINLHISLLLALNAYVCYKLVREALV